MLIRRISYLDKINFTKILKIINKNNLNISQDISKNINF